MIALRHSILCCTLLLFDVPLQAQTWGPVGTGSGSAVYAMEVFEDHLYVGGTFTAIGGINTNYLARWNGSAWSTIGNLIVYQAADGFYAHDTALYIGDAGRVRRWDGTNWSTLPGVFNSSLYSMAHFDDTLFVGGFFSVQGGNPYANVARWNGSAYEPLTSGCNAQVSCLEPFDGRLFVGGNFTVAGDSVVNHTALWDGTAWNRMGNGVNDDVFEQCIFHDTLYIGGRFTQANGLPASRVAKWNGTQWVAVGGPLNDYVTSMHVYHDQLYIGGAFTTPSHIARLSGNTWVPVGGGCNDNVRVMEVYNDTLFVGGSFTQAGGLPVARIAKWYAPPVPIAAFALSTNSPCAGDCIQAIDASTNAPTAWAWSFPGGDPLTSTVSAPTVCYAVPGTYTVSLVVSNASGNTSTSDIVHVDVCSGLMGTHSSNSPMLFPNPASTTLTVRSDHKLGNVQLIDAQGRIVRQLSSSALHVVVDVRELPAGVYALHLTGQAAQRVLIQH